MLSIHDPVNLLGKKNPSFDSSNQDLAQIKFRPSIRRRAFTLIELMVVVVIIGILAAGTTLVVVKVIESQRRGSTNLIIETINTALQTQASKLTDQARKEIDSTTSSDPDADARVRIASYWNSVFIDKLANATTPNYQAMMKSFGISNLNDFDKLSLPSGAVVEGNGKNDPKIKTFEKSFCLYMVLKGKFGVLDPDSLGREAVQTATSTGGKKIPYIADAWGDPIIIDFNQFDPSLPGSPKPPKAISFNQ